MSPVLILCRLKRRPTWGTCAGLILLAESANRTKKGGQELIGGLDVRVNRNHFGRQIESFQADIELPFLNRPASQIQEPPFRAIFIRAPIVEKILPTVSGVQESEACREETIVAPSKATAASGEVQVMATLPGRAAALEGDEHTKGVLDVEASDIIAVRQGNCFGTSFHPELTGDERVHAWWLGEVLSMTEERQAR